MAPAIECQCGKRFETPRCEEATPEEMVEIINNAALHLINAVIESIGTLDFFDNHILSGNLIYEAVTGDKSTAGSCPPFASAVNRGNS